MSVRCHLLWLCVTFVWLCVTQSCELLIRTVEETGVIMREIRELEDQVMYLFQP